jgi:ubiquinone/menaquinone biosynthesis C-methylase UbiE
LSRGAAGTVRAVTASDEPYVRATGRFAVDALYDPVNRLTMRERAWREPLFAQVLAALPGGGTVLEVGAGTGANAIPLAARTGAGRVVAVDGDERILERARRKPGAERVEWRLGLADALPAADGEADAVVMSLLLHHLGPAGKRKALAEALRVLGPGGRLHVADWGRPRGLVTRATFAALRALDGFEPTADHAAGRIPLLLCEAGFGEVATRARVRTTWGTLELLEARR